MTDREQTRRDAEKLIAANESVVFDEHGYDELRFASDCLALLAELEQAERKLAKSEMERLIFKETDEQAEQVLKETAVRLGQAERERDEAIRANVKLAHDLNVAERERDERLTRESGLALVADANRWQEAYNRERDENNELAARLAKVPALVEDLRWVRRLA